MMVGQCHSSNTASLGELDLVEVNAFNLYAITVGTSYVVVLIDTLIMVRAIRAMAAIGKG